MQEGSRAVARLSAESDVRPGQKARLWIDTAKLHLFDPHSGRVADARPRARAAPTAAAGTPA